MSLMLMMSVLTIMTMMIILMMIMIITMIAMVITMMMTGKNNSNSYTRMNEIKSDQVRSSQVK